MKSSSSFTLIEIIVVLIALAILTAVAIPIYQNIVEQTRIDICTANQEALLEAVKIYDMKYDELPSSLAKAWRKHGDEAFAIVWERKRKERDYTYLAYVSFQRFKYFLADIFSINMVHAQPSFSSTITDIKILKCPGDPTPYDGSGNYSYGININAAGRRWEEVLKDPDLEGAPIIGDSDTEVIGGPGATAAAVLSNLAGGRHEDRGTEVALYIDRDGEVEEEEEEEEVEVGTSAGP